MIKILRFLPILLLFIISVSLFSQDQSQEDLSEATERTETAAQNDGVDETNLTFNDDTDSGNVDPVNNSSTWTYVSAILVLGLVVAAIYLLFYFLKKASGRQFSDNDIIRVVSTKAIGQNKNLHVIEIGNEYLLIGASDNGIHLIKEIEDQETRDQLHLTASETPRNPNKGFRDILGSFLPGVSPRNEKPTTKQNPTQVTNETKTFLKDQQDRLKKL